MITPTRYDHNPAVLLMMLLTIQRNFRPPDITMEVAVFYELCDFPVHAALDQIYSRVAAGKLPHSATILRAMVSTMVEPIPTIIFHRLLSGVTQGTRNGCNCLLARELHRR